MGKASHGITPSLGWFFFSEREPQSVKEELLQNLQSQWMTLHLLQSQGFSSHLQEWAALGLYLLQFSRLIERLPLRLAPEAEGLSRLLNAGWPNWVDSVTAEGLAGILREKPAKTAASWGVYMKELEQVLCRLLDQVELA
jgi:hypothetical protein